MSSQHIDRIRRMASDVFGVPYEELTMSSSPDTVANWDSLHHLDLVLSLEHEFALQFTPEEIEQLLSIELVVDLVAEKLEASGVNSTWT